MVIIWLVIYGLLVRFLAAPYQLPALTAYCAVLFVFLCVRGQRRPNGLQLPICPGKQLLLMLPLLSIACWNLMAGRGIAPAEISAGALLFTLLTVFLEELFFRGWLPRKIGGKHPLAVSSVLFGMLHLVNLTQGIDLAHCLLQAMGAACFGLSAALFTALYSSILPAVVIHFLINITASTRITLSLKDYIISAVIAVICAAYAQTVYKKYHD